MPDNIQLHLFDQDGVTMARAPDGSVYRLADVMRYNNPDIPYDDDTGLPVADLEAGTIEARDPTIREKLRYGTANLLDSLGLDEYPAQRVAEGIFGNPNSTRRSQGNALDGMGIADFTPLGAAFAGQEGFRTAKAGYNAGDPVAMAMGGVEAGLGLLEAVPLVGAAARPLTGPVKRLTADGIGAARAIARGDAGLLSEVLQRGGTPQSLSAMRVYHASPHEISGPLRAGSNDVGVHVAANPDLARNASIKSLIQNPSEAENVKVFEFSLDVSPDQVAEISGANNRFDFYSILDDLVGSGRISEDTYNAMYDGLEEIEDVNPIYSSMMEQQNAFFSRELMEREDIKALKYLNEFDAGPNWMDLEAGRFESSVKPDTSYILLDPSQVPQQGLLSDPITQRGDQILGLLQTNPASVTDDMLDMGDAVSNARLNEYLFNNYDLPMDQASRMARAREMGFDTELPLYHGTTDDAATNIGRRGFAHDVFASPDLEAAMSYAENASEYGGEPFAMRLLANPDKGGIDLDLPNSRLLPFGDGDVPSFADAWRKDMSVGFSPSGVRFEDARFDPRLSHLRNLSAGIGGVGLLGAINQERLDQDTRNYLAGGA